MNAGMVMRLPAGVGRIGIRSIRCKYRQEPDQCPARSWWMSTAEDRSPATTGGGMRSPMRERYHPSGHSTMTRSRAPGRQRGVRW